MVIQGRPVTCADLDQIHRMLNTPGRWTRRRLSRELCERWNWRTPLGQLKDIACRSLLRKLDQRGMIRLPQPFHRSMGGRRIRRLATDPVGWFGDPPMPATDAPPRVTQLAHLQPIQIQLVFPGTPEAFQFDRLLATYHYLGFRTSVGENLKYLLRDSSGRTVACALFGAAAWACAPRDVFIGWDATTRARNLGCIANNMRFLILPWIRVPHLASHLLARIAQRIHADWQAKYGHSIALLETFVDRSRFRGTCYRAANWIGLGQTKGRTRQDRDQTIRVPVKDVYVYPLHKNFRHALTTP